MIQIKDVDFIPELPYGDYAKRELASAGDIGVYHMQQKSSNIFIGLYDDLPMFAAGIVHTALTSKPALWFLLCENTDARYVRGIAKLRPVMDRWPGLQTTVERGWWPGLKFAQFSGFRPLIETPTHLIMER